MALGIDGMTLDQLDRLLDAVAPGGIDLDGMLAEIAEQDERALPCVGMGATIHAWTDRYAGTVERVDFHRDGTVKRVLIREDRAIVIGGGVHDGSARYRYERETELNHGRVWNAVQRKNGTWHDGTWTIGFGHRDRYEDPSF